jgi:hypothetical protein
MSRRAYLLITAIIFSLIALLHLGRIIFGWSAIWQLERAYVAELGSAHRDQRLGLFRVPPCDTALTKRPLRLRLVGRRSNRPHQYLSGSRMRFTATITRMQAELRGIEAP